MLLMCVLFMVCSTVGIFPCVPIVILYNWQMTHWTTLIVSRPHVVHEPLFDYKQRKYTA